MRYCISALLLTLIVCAGLVTGAVAADKPAFVFATPEEGKGILTTRDEFILNMGPLDRAIRMRSEKPVSTDQFLEFIGNNVTPWEDDEKQKVQAVLDSLKSRLAPYARFLPDTIYLVRTTGNEEGGVAYTRGNAIVFPRRLSTGDVVGLYKLISHELFHIITRRDRKLAEELYGVIGFIRCPAFKFPEKMETRRITNPDAPSRDHCIHVTAGRQKLIVIPVLYSNVDAYSRHHGEELFDYLQVALLSVAKDNGPEKKPAMLKEKQMKLYKEEELSGFFEQIGKNTDYTIHPEEILADNFSYLLLGVTNMESPQIVEKMKMIFERK